MGEVKSDRLSGDYLSCWERYDPRRDPVEFINLLCLISLAVGVCLIFVGYLYPREYDFDPTKDARDMEAIEIEYEKLSWTLDICIMMGMACVGIGAFILTAILTYLFFKGEIVPICGDDPDHDEREMLYPMETKQEKSYGTKTINDEMGERKD